MTPAAHSELSRACPLIGRLIGSHGPCTLTPEPDRTPFESLVRAVAHQQLNGTAAATILKRFKALFGGRFPTAARLAEADDEALRGVGFSRAKVAAIRDIAAKTLDGTVPGTRVIKAMSDDEIIARLVSVGRWTVEMLLIFKLGRPDVLPADDFGVRTGFRVVQGLDALPSPKELRAYGERWRPHSTTAAWFLWRAADAAKPSPKTKSNT